MKHEVKIVARTMEINNPVTIQCTNDDLTLLAGKAAGVCYMPDNYMEDGIQNTDKAFARAEQTSKSGHHSVYDHGHITMVIKTNKMMAMILNSLGVYATSEKSARYTKMQPETELELQLYEKWKAKIKDLILAKYPDTDDVELKKRFNKKFNELKDNVAYNPDIKNGEFVQCTNNTLRNILAELKQSETLPSAKLAQENARYMISVFTPTTMMYTVSIRQLFLTINYLDKLITKCNENDDTFSEKLLNSVIELKEAFEKAIGEQKLNDNKNQNIRFLEYQVADDKAAARIGKKEQVSDTYTLVYNGSLAMLAQAQRHRTLRYSMYLTNAGEFGWYVPMIVSDAGLSDEWLEDITSVAYCVPQGTMVRITEQGLFEDFALKCKERMCGRAQLEVMHSTTNSTKKFINSIDNLSYSNQSILKSMTVDKDDRDCKGLTPCARCMFKDFKCSEGCQWGPKNALNRLI